MKIERGLALQDLITGAYEYVQELELPKQTRVYLLDQLAVTEFSNNVALISYIIDHLNRHRLSSGGSEKLQLSGLIGAFKHAAEISA